MLYNYYFLRSGRIPTTLSLLSTYECSIGSVVSYAIASMSLSSSFPTIIGCPSISDADRAPLSLCFTSPSISSYFPACLLAPHSSPQSFIWRCITYDAFLLLFLLEWRNSVRRSPLPCKLHCFCIPSSTLLSPMFSSHPLLP